MWPVASATASTGSFRPPGTWQNSGNEVACPPCNPYERPECRYYQQGNCNMINDPFHRHQFMHTCKYHPACTRANDPQHRAMFDHPGMGSTAEVAEAPSQRNRRPCSFFLQGRCHKMDDPKHAEDFSHGPEQVDIPAFAFDCEFIEIIRVDPDGQTLDPVTRRISHDRSKIAFRWPVSIGVVDQHMETLMYTRIRTPSDTIVHDDRFSRVGSGIRSGWTVGLSRRDVTSMIVQLIRESNGELQRSCLVGWHIAHDLRALGFEQAAVDVEHGEREGLVLSCQDVAGIPSALERSVSVQSEVTDSEIVCNVVELQDYFRTSVADAKVKLGEAFRFELQRARSAHDAVEDARMTMELYIAWHRQGRPVVHFECEDMCIIPTSLTHSYALNFDLSIQGVRSEERKSSFRTQMNGCLVRLSEGLLQLSGTSIELGKAFYLRRLTNFVQLYDTETHARDLSSSVGLQKITDVKDAILTVACEFYDRSEVGKTFKFEPRGTYLAGKGIVAKEDTVEGKGWVFVKGSDDLSGWVGPVTYGRKNCLRIIRPFPLQLHMYNLLFDSFSGDALARANLLLDLKPSLALNTGDTPPQEDVDRDQNQCVQSYRLRFRERVARDAYWRTIQDKFEGYISLKTSSSGQPNDPWRVHGGTTLSISWANPYAGHSVESTHGCLAHIWDHPR